jgi:ornithine cyclodeaminase/alanine dehydrogenase-like protein (mu-crystallin family)
VTRGFILLFSVKTGDLLAVLGEGHIRNLRVGAAAGLAAIHLARKGDIRVGLLGAGFMARAHLDAIGLVRNIRAVKVYSPNREHRDRFAQEMSSALKINVEPVNDSERAIEGADVVILATNALIPVIDPLWLEPGMHITCVRHCEIGKESYARCDIIVLNSKKNFRVWHYASQSNQEDRLPEGILLDYEKGYPPGEVTDIDWDNLPDLPDLLLGRHPGRTREDEITCFDNSVGFGLQFAAVAGRTYEVAMEKGIGREAPKDCFPDLV